MDVIGRGADRCSLRSAEFVRPARARFSGRSPAAARGQLGLTGFHPGLPDRGACRRSARESTPAPGRGGFRRIEHRRRQPRRESRIPQLPIRGNDDCAPIVVCNDTRFDRQPSRDDPGLIGTRLRGSAGDFFLPLCARWESARQTKAQHQPFEESSRPQFPPLSGEGFW